MNLLTAYLISLDTEKQVLNSLQSLYLTPPEEKRPDYVRLRENSYVMSEQIEHYTGIVTAHKLSQYQNKLHRVALDEDITTWLDILIQDDIKNRERIMLR